MWSLIRDLFRALTPSQRRGFAALQVLVVLRSLAEIASVAAIGPFTMLASNPGVLEGSGMLARLYRSTGLQDPMEFTILLGVAALVVLTLGALISIFTTYFVFTYSQNIGADISTRLFGHYLNQPWLYHAQHNSSLLTKRITIEAARITKGIVTPLMQMIASLVLASLMSLALFLLEPVVTAVGVAMFSIAYLMTYGTVRRRISHNGKAISRQNARQFKLMSEGFGGIREVLLRDSQVGYLAQFQHNAFALARAQARNSALAQAPRYIIELAAIASLVFAVVYLMQAYDGNVGIILPLLSVYGLAAFKLLPAFQSVYASLATIKGAQAAFVGLKKDLDASQRTTVRHRDEGGETLHVRDAIVVDGIGFTYPGSHGATLAGVDMEIPAGRIVGLVGASGAGKSTLIDVLLALVAPQRGRILIDGQVLDAGIQASWRRSVGFVPQSIYLADSSILENVAFGVDPPRVDSERVTRALRLACLDDFVASLPEGVMTHVGERGVQLSGGQRQRIGIARALYSDPSFLILDEATNSLDVVTEDKILNAVVNAASERTTLIVAHRLRTLKTCDVVYLIERGKVLASGTYEELASSNATFRKLDLLS